MPDISSRSWQKIGGTHKLGNGQVVIGSLYKGVLVSQGCCHKLPQTWWLKATDIYFLTNLEARRQVSEGLHSLWKLQGRVLFCLFQLLVAVGIPWLL